MSDSNHKSHSQIENIHAPAQEELPEHMLELNNELKNLIEEYNTAARELLEKHAESIAEDQEHFNHEDHAQAHENLEHFNHSINEMRAELIHLEECNHRFHEIEEEHKKEFFNHHSEAMLHISNHWSHMQAHFNHLREESFEDELEELEEFHHRIFHLLTELKREKEQEILGHQKHLTPHPTPGHSGGGHEEK